MVNRSIFAQTGTVPNRFDRSYLGVGPLCGGMTTVTLSREFSVPPETIAERIREDVPSFVRASGFDSVTVDGDAIVVERKMGMATLELTLEIVEEPDAVLALDQTEGIFEEMWTEYTVEPSEAGSVVTARTEFTLGGVLGPVLDATMIKSRREQEFEDQFAYLEEVAAPA